MNKDEHSWLQIAMDRHAKPFSESRLEKDNFKERSDNICV